MQYKITARNKQGETREIQINSNSLSNAETIAARLTSYFDLGGFIVHSYTLTPMRLREENKQNVLFTPSKQDIYVHN